MDSENLFGQSQSQVNNRKAQYLFLRNGVYTKLNNNAIIQKEMTQKLDNHTKQNNNNHNFEKENNNQKYVKEDH